LARVLHILMTLNSDKYVQEGSKENEAKILPNINKHSKITRRCPKAIEKQRRRLQHSHVRHGACPIFRTLDKNTQKECQF
jgi:hypothetical protein